MTDTPKNDDEFVPDGEAAGDGPEAPLFEVPDDASSLTTEGAPREAAHGASDAVKELEAQLAERTHDLQRLHAEYVNYKKRVDRDRDVARQRGVESVVNDLMPVLDAIEAARQHGDFEGGFKLVVDALEKVAAKYGLVAYGEVGDEFDPHIHEALMHMPLEGDHDTTVVSVVVQKGIRMGDRIVRPARVGVADPS